nr:hypothetical protein [Amycolatopsis sp. GM8]
MPIPGQTEEGRDAGKRGVGGEVGGQQRRKIRYGVVEHDRGQAGGDLEVISDRMSDRDVVAQRGPRDEVTARRTPPARDLFDVDPVVGAASAKPSDGRQHVLDRLRMACLRS